jgi:hypothetical protein
MVMRVCVRVRDIIIQLEGEGGNTCRYSIKWLSAIPNLVACLHWDFPKLT